MRRRCRRVVPTDRIAAQQAGRAVAPRVVLLGLLVSACAVPQSRDVLLATTTSVEDSGLLDELIPAFEAAHPSYRVKASAVGSGQAFELGRRGDVDVLITHARAQEEAFVRDGFGVEAFPIMHNRFVVVGPAADPANVREATGGVDAFRRIAGSGATFVSRGDNSGTNIRENMLWGSAGIAPAGQSWYVEAGVGMGDALRFAGERDAYTLSDRATFVVVGSTTELDLLLDAPADADLQNPYSVTAVVQANNPGGARTFINWIRSPEVQELIGEYRADAAGVGLFRPQEPVVLQATADVAQLAAGTNRYVLDVIWLSLRVSGLALLIAVLIGVPAGAAVGVARFRGRGLVVALIHTGFALPPVVVGLFVYMALSRTGPLGSLGLLFTPTAMVIAQAILAAPYVTGITLAAVQAVPADVRSQARALGASHTRALLTHMREARLGIVAAVIAGFGAVISEVGAVMLVGGNVLDETRVMTTAILLETRRGNFSTAIVLGIVLLGLAFAVNLALTRAQQGARDARVMPAPRA